MRLYDDKTNYQNRKMGIEMDDVLTIDQALMRYLSNALEKYYLLIHIMEIWLLLFLILKLVQFQLTV